MGNRKLTSFTPDFPWDMVTSAFNMIYRFFEKFNMLLPPMKLTYFCEINFISATHGPARGDNLIRKWPKWTILTKFRKFYG